MGPFSRSRAGWRPGDVALLAAMFAATLGLLVVGHVLDPQFALHAQQLAPPPALAVSTRALPAQSGLLPAPETVVSAFMGAPQALSGEQMQAGLLDSDKLTVTWAGRRVGAVMADAGAAPVAGTEVTPRDVPMVQPPGSDPVPRFLHRVVPLTPSNFGLAVRMIAEPSVAVGDSVLWTTGNWFAARSTDRGGTWNYVNPYADFPTFTSDQDTVYDPHRRLFVWYRQGSVLRGRLENSVRLSVSSDGAASWCSYTLRPSDVDPAWHALQFDYPHLALTDNYLYVSSTLLVTGAGYATPRMVLLRFPLDALGACTASRYVYWTTDEGWSWTPVENGATTTMYLGDTLDPGGTEAMGVFRVYAQPEWTTTLFYTDRAVPAWTFSERNALCAVQGRGNPCARSDQRVTSGWVRHVNGRGEVGFLWNVREGGGFPYPYIDAVTFDEGTLSVTGRPMLWDTKCAWHYGAAAPNGEDLGIAAFYFCPSQPPAHVVGVGEGEGAQVKWTTFYSRIGDVPTSTQVWGDYVRIRADGRGFVATGYTISSNGAQPFLVPFGRNPLAGAPQ